MKIGKHAVVSIDYVLTDDDGTVLDTSEENGPLSYLHGVGEIVPGLERQLDGAAVGDQLKLSVAPDEAYGVRDESLRTEVARDQFEDVGELELGMQFQVESESGPQVITIVEIAPDVVTIDGNHPLAGVNLHFAVTIRDAREATSEELDHGHAHGPDDGAH